MTHLNIKKTGGYDEFFLNQIKDKYKCPVCLLVLREPIQTQCGHRLCLSCSEEIKKRKEGILVCPLDNIVSNASKTFSDKAFERDILQLKVKCYSFSKNCQWTGELRSINKHLESCEFEEVKCRNKQCTTMLMRKDISFHMETNCNYRLVPCHYCAQKFQSFQLEIHHSECDEFLDDCPNECGMIMTRGEMSSHITNDCSDTIVSCEFFYDIGCDFQGMRKDQNAHADSSIHNHLIMAASKIKDLKSDQREMMKKITSLENEMKSNEKKMMEKIMSLENKINSDAKDTIRNTIIKRKGYPISSFNTQPDDWRPFGKLHRNDFLSTTTTFRERQIEADLV